MKLDSKFLFCLVFLVAKVSNGAESDAAAEKRAAEQERTKRVVAALSSFQTRARTFCAKQTDSSVALGNDLRYPTFSDPKIESDFNISAQKPATCGDLNSLQSYIDSLGDGQKSDSCEQDAKELADKKSKAMSACRLFNKLSAAAKKGTATTSSTDQDNCGNADTIGGLDEACDEKSLDVLVVDKSRELDTDELKEYAKMCPHKVADQAQVARDSLKEISKLKKEISEKENSCNDDISEITQQIQEANQAMQEKQNQLSEALSSQGQSVPEVIQMTDAVSKIQAEITSISTEYNAIILEAKSKPLSTDQNCKVALVKAAEQIRAAANIRSVSGRRTINSQLTETQQEEEIRQAKAAYTQCRKLSQNEETQARWVAENKIKGLLNKLQYLRQLELQQNEALGRIKSQSIQKLAREQQVAYSKVQSLTQKLTQKQQSCQKDLNLLQEDINQQTSLLQDAEADEKIQSVLEQFMGSGNASSKTAKKTSGLLAVSNLTRADADRAQERMSKYEESAEEYRSAQSFFKDKCCNQGRWPSLCPGSGSSRPGQSNGAGGSGRGLGN